MAIYGVDIHPRYQAGISIEQIRREGFEFMAVKVSEARNVSSYEGSFDWLARGQRAGLLCLGYHYLRAGDEDTQARLFAGQLRRAGVPGMIDAEAGAGNITNIRRFHDACQRHGAKTPLLYLPRWYWEQIGRPDLRGLPALWASRYVGTGTPTGPASTMYQDHNPAGWDSYGGGQVAVLQFTDRARVAGKNIDANHYRGTRGQFAALIGLANPPQEVGVQGLIAEHYNNTPGLKEILGPPTTPELPTADGVGRFNRFANLGGHIYWHPELGAHAVWGAIQDKYGELDWERGPLGYPLSDEFTAVSARSEWRQSNFQRGYITWTPGGGATAHT